MNVILFGAPGAGKGTQSSFLVDRLGMVQISTGDLFRAAIKNKTDLGVLAQGYMDKGDLVPDAVVIGMVQEALSKLEGRSFILDGFPRTVAQAEELEKILVKLNVKIGQAIFLEVPQGDLIERLTGRRVCKSCGAVYHVKSKPSKQESVCDLCGGDVIQRNDDKLEVIATRLKNYEESTLPLKTYFKNKGQYLEVDGNRSTEEVFSDIKKNLT